jgi:hypothetical protein
LAQDYDKIDGSSQKKTAYAIMEDQMNKVIDAKRHQIREALKEVEKNTRASYLSHIEYHKYLLEQAKEKGDVATALHHRVMMETYESILKNYSMSNSYDNV